ncbi:hypothetical protein H6G54_28495 [Anabaena cylindrica FACHB-243]|uniref:Uncharacterized protein n=1 Tax=Anabaena cylindrica (strain ATCC 27899 / PCC 7122) TaxID=272123 RepID=K9ZSC4_ANACC|nr:MULTISPECIES: hypothetical protein [Anabaena]AFZ61437.1 hypothetical protein Anacy_6168 [Anabaena cylindrica PCC 7122]MBD2421547.1 hypothetical protein [Anabaena cylindrica FACHB-243]MBY5284246.1 hypothetical protein [Anabaena sp. CCAP 1446/1C]MBY5310617.1 hypothetical protein [Anabaena sp. CCAP 1446/1C]MCM2405962.1 hypothetical protein [Anabaena sp. CCAP 1446/1C]
MPKAAAKTKLETAQEKLKDAAKPQETIKLDPTPIKTNNNHQASVFNPSDYLASNLFADSSTLPRTTKVDADKQIQSISEKRETLRLVGANLQLNTDVYKTGSLSEKMSQASITWSTDRIGTDTKLVGLETAKVTHQIAEVKLGQTQEKLTHAGIELTGLQGETPLRQAFWVAKLSLIESRIAQVELAKFQLDAKIGAIESEAESIN